MRQFVLRILDIGTDPADDPDLVLRKRTAVGSSIAICAASLVFSAISALADRQILLVVSLLLVIGQALNIVLFGRTRNLALATVITITLGYLLVFTGIPALGGLALSAGSAVWGILAPLGAILFLGARAGWPTYFGLIAVIVAGALIDPLIPDDQALPHEVAVVIGVYNVIGPALIAMLLVIYIDGQRLAARRQSDALLLNVLPEPIADRLKAGERVIADHYDQASVLFADIVNFTPLSESKSPEDVVSILNGLFIEFDRLAELFDLEKIKTIGDAYMVVAGVPDPRDDHAAVLMEMALAMHARVADYPAVDGRRLEVRIGIASGPLVAGVIGERKFSYDLWGDTVNTAARMESSGVP
ncbi:MAG TPA: adenylate/guanylate cyclase domain-containing protein, partial [Candidatus Limnocylindria bacterium]|nr:adenylate/guanylate cyclase domain-containing protein [Candidatus Limnocylindria bacterium]